MIEFDHVRAGYAGREVLHEVTFAVPKGSVTALIGPNGCGKTTLLRAAAGQLPLQSGKVLLNGRETAHLDRKELARTGAGRELRTLSGGERQRVYIAMALAQDTGIILLDEPTTYLDLGRQFELLELIRSLNAGGKTILMVLHDLALALRYSNKIALMEQGRLAAFAGPEELLDSGRLDEVFGVQSHRTPYGCCFTPRPKG